MPDRCHRLQPILSACMVCHDSSTLLIQRQLHSHTHKLLQAEEAERRTLIANRDVNDASQDLTKLRRTSLSVQSAPRSLDLHATVGAAAQKAVSVVGQEALVEVSNLHC